MAARYLRLPDVQHSVAHRIQHPALSRKKRTPEQEDAIILAYIKLALTVAHDKDGYSREIREEYFREVMAFVKLNPSVTASDLELSEEAFALFKSAA